VDSLRVFVDAIGGEAVEISDANLRDLGQLCEEFKFIELAKTAGDWEAEHPQISPVIRRALDLGLAAQEERLESQGRMMLMVDQALDRQREVAISDAERFSAMEAEVSGLRSLLGETAASGQKAARDIDQVKAAAAEQRLAHGRDICAFEEEIGRVRDAMAAIGRSVGQQEGEQRAAIGDLQRKATQERSEVSRLKELLGSLDGKREELRATVARQGDELAANGRRNSGLEGRVDQLEEENGLLRESSEGLKAQFARV
jgi:chromosome segregation ATPase